MVNQRGQADCDTEALILKAAEKEFFNNGYAGARTTSIAEAAGVTHAMLHYYFRTKENLFEKIIAEKMASLKEVMLSAMGEKDLPLFDRIKQGVERHFDFIANNPMLPRFVINEIFSHPERYDMIGKAINSIASSLLEDLQAQIDKTAGKGECRKIDARMLLLDIISLNIFSFVAAPVIEPILGPWFSETNGFLEKRKAENVETILRKLKA